MNSNSVTSLRIFKEHKILSFNKTFTLSRITDLDNIFIINDLRVESTHPTKVDKKFKEITKGLSYFSYAVTLEFLSALNMLPIDYGKERAQIFNNLPPSDCIEFIGREHQVQEVVDALMNERFPIVSIDGIGGVGKSTLAIECASKLAEKSIFDAIIWLGAKKQKLTSEGIKDIENSFENLEDLFTVVLKAFGASDFLEYNFETKKAKVLEILQNNACLMVIDNLETIEDQNLKRFLIDDLPPLPKTLITSRERLGELEKVVWLKEFSLDETGKYIHSQLKHRGYTEPITDILIKRLHAASGGIPLALRISIPWIIEGKLGPGTSEDKVFEKSEVLKFCFEKVFNDFLDEDTKNLFLMMSVSPSDISESALKFISGLSEEKFTTNVNSLIKYSLISKIQSIETAETLFSMLPLTQLFGRKLVEEKHKEIRTRVSREYLKYFQITSDEKVSAKRAMSLNKAEEAMRLSRAGNDSEAESLFREALNYDKDDDYALYLYAIFSKERQNYGQAMELIQRAINLQKENPVYWIEFSNILELWGDFRKAERILEEALRRCSHDMRITQKLVVIKERLNKIEEAMALAEKHINMNPVDTKQTFLNTLFVVAILEGNWRLGCRYRQTNPDASLAYFLDSMKSMEKYRSVIQPNNAKLQFHEKKILKAIVTLSTKRRYYECTPILRAKSVFRCIFRG